MLSSSNGRAEIKQTCFSRNPSRTVGPPRTVGLRLWSLVLSARLGWFKLVRLSGRLRCSGMCHAGYRHERCSDGGPRNGRLPI